MPNSHLGSEACKYVWSNGRSSSIRTVYTYTQRQRQFMMKGLCEEINIACSRRLIKADSAYGFSCGASLHRRGMHARFNSILKRIFQLCSLCREELNPIIHIWVM